MRKDKLYISFDSNVEKDKLKSEFGRGKLKTVTWDQLLPYIENHVWIDLDEKLVGLRVDENGITAKLVKEDKRKKAKH